MMDDDAEEFAGLEPFFFDEAVVVAQHPAAEEKRRQKEQEEALKKERRMQKAIAYQSVLHKITEYDPKLGCEYITRFYMADLCAFDLDEEYREGNGFIRKNSVNVISVKTISSDVRFPIYVYGIVIARDSIAWGMCEDQLILTGPKRGLALIDAIYFEMDLKIKGEQGQQDKELSKGFLRLDGIQHQFLDTMIVESDSLETKLIPFNNRSIQLLRPVIAVCMEEMLEVTLHKVKVKAKFFLCLMPTVETTLNLLAVPLPWS
ncbi:hypothetical protein EJB05_34434 [Eragrostis curvula]|uniref:DUF6598 domain-containing protein n=1 Tax=Eragrostis curvula TaxID=38414 RepID=A0A5J9U445_9POAL|nr:hypothetical protein EJB05_34434 [Eragrostis curvula]